MSPKSHKSNRKFHRLNTFGAWNLVFLWCLVFGIWCFSLPAASPSHILNPSSHAHHIARFNSIEDENVTNFVSNANSWDWLTANIPLFDCPDPEIQEIYYFRWWSFRKHIVQTTNGFVLTEFLVPMRHAGAFNTISCAVGHHLAEGRWLRDQRYVDDYTKFWLRGHDGKPQPHFHKYSSWFAAAVHDRYLVNGDREFLISLLDDLVSDYRAWEKEKRFTNGLFWQNDVWDGMEESISGSRTEKNIRPTINSYMFANARAIADIARLARRTELAAEFEKKSSEIKRTVQDTLWNPAANFFEVRRPNSNFSDVREELGFIPWYFNLPDPGHEAAWAQLLDPQGFRAPFGITTAERRHPKFRSHGCCKCEWDGAVWPFATSQTLVALANVLHDYPQKLVTSGDYFDAFLTYVHSQHYDGKPYIGEYLDETTGQWLKGKVERSRYYNHSTFADLLITGLIGLRPRADDKIDVQPLLPDNLWNWFCLDGINYHRHTLTILWDKDGQHYGRGKGFFLLTEGKEIGHTDRLGNLSASFP
jgi:hypothetical protein